MKRDEIMDMMKTLKLRGMMASYDEVLLEGRRNRHSPPRIIGALLRLEIADKQARSLRYRLSQAKLPHAKELDDFDFSQSEVPEAWLGSWPTLSFCPSAATLF